MRRLFAGVQQLGRSLMLPIAVLPIAGLLLRLGQPDLLDIAFVSAAGEAIFAHLGVIFAVGVAIGFARDNHGAAGLAGLVAFLVATESAKMLIELPPATLDATAAAETARALADYRDAAIAKLGVPLGILCGILSGLLFNRYANIRLPEFLAFFGGRRFVPIASGAAGLALGFAFGEFWQETESAIDHASRAIVGAGEIGLFLYGMLNRLLIVTGLHHILNNVAWFVIGDFEGTTGDLRRFFAGDPAAGGFMAGFFPVMMFGMPAACLAMYRAALPARRKQVAGLYLSMGLTSALTGITEPIEFTFIFLAPLLYLVHAVLTGLSMVVMDLLEAKLGFGFSAGLIDYVLNYGIATNPLLLLPVGLAYFAIYYATFSFVIRRFDLATPGRGAEAAPMPANGHSGEGHRGAAWLAALGGAGNIVQLGACTTRLRLVLRDPGLVDEAALSALGTRGTIRPTADTLQVIVGPTAELLCADIDGAMQGAPAITTAPPTAAPAARGRDSVDPELYRILGGAANVVDFARVPGRIMVRLAEPGMLDLSALRSRRDFRHVHRAGGGLVHILVAGQGPEPERIN